MFWPSVDDMHDFYSTPLGGLMCRNLRQHIRTLWPHAVDDAAAHLQDRVVGIGYTTPYLIPFLTVPEEKNAPLVIALSPAGQGVLKWPVEKPNRAAMTLETLLPLPEESVDRVVLIHALEFTEQASSLLREVWRVLRGSGKLLVIVPNRRSIWARTEITPLGHGRPFTEGQLEKILHEAMFTVTQMYSALFIPPTRSRTVLRTSSAWESMGKRWLPSLGGVIMAEAEKRLYAGTMEWKSATRTVMVEAPE